MIPPLARLLPDGRLHLQHGPIDLVVEATAMDASQLDRPHDASIPSTVARAYRAAARRFETVLPDLCRELSALRGPTCAGRLRGTVARRMEAATLPYAAETFVTPMAAVAGAVAEAVLAALLDAGEFRRASVNNGGDIALHLGPDESVRIGLVDRPEAPSLFATTTIGAGDGIRGIATSGWRGRSLSRGIADAVTILAGTAAEADAAATIVANAVDLPGHPAVVRLPARDVQSDSDLGHRLVTRAVGPLGPDEIDEALRAGLAKADDLARRGLIRAAALHLQGRTATTASLRSHLDRPVAVDKRIAGREIAA